MTPRRESGRPVVQDILLYGVILNCPGDIFNKKTNNDSSMDYCQQDGVVRCLATTRMGTENGNDDKNGSVNVNENENDLLFV